MATSKDIKKGKVVSIKAETKKVEKQEEVTLTFKRDTFQKDIAVANDFTEKKGTMPILSHIRFDNDGNHCRITATDLEVAWTKIISCKGAKIAICVPAALLLKEVKALPLDVSEVILIFKDKSVSVNGRCKIFTLPADDFPKRPDIKGWTELKIDNFIGALKKVSAAMGDGDSRYTLNGAYLDFKNNTVIATDGHRLHRDDTKVWDGQAEPVIIPRRAVQLMIKYPLTEAPKLTRSKPFTMHDKMDLPANYELDVCGHKVKVSYKPEKHSGQFWGAEVTWTSPLSDKDMLYREPLIKAIKEFGTLKEYIQRLSEKKYLQKNKTVFINVSKTHMTYPAADGEMLVRAIEGTFPKWHDVIPKNNPVKITFKASDFLQNMEGALPLTHDSNTVTLKVNGAMIIETNSPDRGTYKWHIPCKATGKKGEIDIRFNAKYLIDALKSYDIPEAVIEMAEAISPALVNKKAVVMPMRPEKDCPLTGK